MNMREDIKALIAESLYTKQQLLNNNELVEVLEQVSNLFIDCFNADGR